MSDGYKKALNNADGPEVIFLSPSCCDDVHEGRMWCPDDVWEDCGDPECACASTKYIRADLVADPLRTPASATPASDEVAETIDGFETGNTVAPNTARQPAPGDTLREAAQELIRQIERHNSEWDNIRIAKDALRAALGEPKP